MTTPCSLAVQSTIPAPAIRMVLCCAANRVITERFARVGERAMDYEFTIDDADTFTDRVTARLNFSMLAGRIYEFACHEGNYALMNMLRIARVEKQGLISAD